MIVISMRMTRIGLEARTFNSPQLNKYMIPTSQVLFSVGANVETELTCNRAALNARYHKFQIGETRSSNTFVRSSLSAVVLAL